MFISAKLRWVGLWFQFNGIYQHVMTEICGVFEFDDCMGSLPWKKKKNILQKQKELGSELIGLAWLVGLKL